MNAALLVLGMHRSGTSALTRVLSLLGARLPTNLMPGYEGKNDLGHWESLDLMEIHDAMLASVGSSWDDVTEFPESWIGSPASDEYRARILDVLEHDYAKSSLFVVKDPRVCRFVPLWLDLVAQFGAEPHAIIPVRNPLEVAASLKRRDGFPIARGAMLWLRHVLDAERTTRDCKRSLITYEALLDDWGSAAEKIDRDLGIAWPRGAHRAGAEIEEFLSSNLRHHRSSPEALRSHSQIVPWVADAHDALLALTVGDDESARDRLDAIRAEVALADRAFGPLLAEGQIRTERAEDRLQSAESTIAGLEAELAAERDRLGQATAQVARLDAALADQKRQVADHESALSGQAQELTERESRLVALMADAAQRDREVAERDLQIMALDRQLAIREAELAGRDARIALFESSRESERETTALLQRLIYESQQEILRDFTILERLDAVEQRGAKIEASTGQALAILEPTPPAAAVPSGRRWARHLPSPSALKARLSPPAQKVLARLRRVGHQADRR